MVAISVPAAPAQGPSLPPPPPAYTPPPPNPLVGQIVSTINKLSGAAPSGLGKQARAQANATIQDQIADIRRQQALIQQQAQQRAAAINAASQAAAHFEQGLGLGNSLAAAFQQAAGQQAAAAQGFTGQIRDTAAGEAATVQHNLAALGAPGSPVNNAPAAANAVYESAGALPASVLSTAAPLVLAQAQQAPRNLIAGGVQEGIGAIGAGQQEAGKLNAQIDAAIAKLPQLVQDNIAALGKQAENARQDSLRNLYQALAAVQRGDTAAATASWRTAQQADARWKTTTQALTDEFKAAQGANKPTYRTDAYGRLLEVTPTGIQAVSTGTWTDPSGQAYTVGLDGKFTPVGNARPTTPHTSVVSDATGQWLIDDATGAKIRKVGGPSASATPRPVVRSIPGGGIVRVNPNGTVDTLRPSSTSTRTYKIPSGIVSGATKLANTLHGNTGSTLTTTSGNTLSLGSGQAQRKPYAEALRRMEAYLRGAGVPKKAVTAAAQSFLEAAGYPSPDTVQRATNTVNAAEEAGDQAFSGITGLFGG